MENVTNIRDTPTRRQRRTDAARSQAKSILATLWLYGVDGRKIAPFFQATLSQEHAPTDADIDTLAELMLEAQP